MNTELRTLVRNRAGDRCEYCRIRQQDDAFFRFHVEHIIPRQHGGNTEASNLALACHHCNLHKGPNLTGIDPVPSEIARLFHPRTQRWEEHFVINGVLVAGLTPTGRTTVRLLAMNKRPRWQLQMAST